MSITPQHLSSHAGYAKRPQVQFAGAQEFAQKHQLSPEAVEKDLPLLLNNINLNPVLKSLDPATRLSFLASLKKLAGNVPLGNIERRDGKIYITSYDNEKGEPRVKVLDEAARPHVYGPDTDVKTFLKKTLGDQPRVIINPVGWTIPNPEVLIQNNPTFKKQADQLKELLVQQHGAEAPNLEKLYQKGLKKLAGDAYEQAFNKFWEPISTYLFEERGLESKHFAFLTSASYAGIDKAAMDYADKKNISVVNVTPYTYAEWMNDEKSYPLLVTNTVDDYAEACAQGAGILFVTGGRDHAWQKDVNNFLIQQKKFVVPVDVLKESLDFDIPATRNGNVDNAARMLIDRGLNIRNASLAKNVRNSVHLTEEQKYVAGAIETLYNQITFSNPAVVAANVK